MFVDGFAVLLKDVKTVDLLGWGVGAGELQFVLGEEGGEVGGTQGG